ncbi:MAG: DUF1800 family protein, partial [Chloroflexota bacterium]
MSRKHPTAGTPAPSKHDVLLSNVAHALRRAGFGATRNEIALAARQDLKQTVDALINYQLVPDTLSPPDAAILGNDSMMQKFPIDPLVQWWLTQMLSTSRPLQEKMVLFWHGHFATAYYKVRSTTYMYLQNQIFRDNALGRF